MTSLTYDVENHVKSIAYPSSATNAFAYNGEDLRVQKVDSSGTSNYVTDGSSPASAVLKDGSAVYTPGLSERRGTTSKLYHADALGSTRGITDNTQAVTDSLRYDAFGNVASRTGTTPTPFGFVGKAQYQTDGDSGLLLLGHRYYDPSIGRFLSQDPIQDGDNWYAYCDNNPLDDIDPSGLLPKHPERPPIDPNRGHKNQGNGKKNKGKHTDPRAGDKGNQGMGNGGYEPRKPGKPGQRSPAPPARNARPPDPRDPARDPGFNKGPKQKSFNPYATPDPYLGPGPAIDPNVIAGGIVIIIGIGIIVSTGQVEIGGPLLGIGGKMVGATN